MKELVKHLFVKSLSSAPLSAVGDKFYGKHVPVFMLHRFACPDLGIEGHDLSLLEYALEFMRGKGFNFVSVEDVALAVQNETTLPPRSVAFSIDDGYWDHVEIPSQLFARYDCPTTYFITTGFVGKELWFWDAKVEFMLDAIKAQGYGRLQEIFPNLELSAVSKAAAREAIVFDLANYNFSHIQEKIEQISTLLEVDIPVDAPEKYASTSWERLREIEKQGMRIAAHTYSHPILSKEDDKTVRFEIQKSRDDVKKNVESPSNIFCYPVGRSEDFGEREQQICRESGFLGAVSAAPPVVDLADKGKLFCLPRFAFPSTKTDVIQYSTWIESFKNSLRN